MNVQMNQPTKKTYSFFTKQKLSTCYSFLCVGASLLVIFLIETLCVCGGENNHPSIQRYSDQQKTMKKKYKKYLARMKERHQQQQQHTSLTLREFFSFVQFGRPTNQPKIECKKKLSSPLPSIHLWMLLVVLFSLFFACFQCPFSSKTLCECVWCVMELN